MVNITNYWGIQIKATIRYHLTSDRMAIIKRKKKKKANDRCWGECGGKKKQKQQHSCTVGGILNW